MSKKAKRMTLVAIIAGAVVLGIAAFVWLNTPAARTTRELLDLGVGEEGSKFVDVAGVRTYYREGGSGPVVLLIHGTPSHTYTWQRIFEPLCKRFRVIAFDLKGHGLTDSPDDDYTIRKLADFTLEFMNALDLDQVLLVGHSAGGEIGWRLALRRPGRIRKMVLISPSGYPREDLPFTESFIRLPVLGRVAAGMTSRWLVRSGLEYAFQDPANATEDLVEQYYQRMRKEGNREAMRKIACEQPDDLYKQMPEVRAPTLVIWGENDHSVPTAHAALFERDLPDARVEILPDCAHMPQWEKPGEVVRLVMEFLAGPQS